MALVKFAPDISPLIGELSGFTFQNSRIGSVMFRGQANDRTRYSCQVQRKMNITAANAHWRNMSEAEKANWNTFAAAFPEPTKRDPNVFLTGYQLYCKRQSYIFLSQGVTAPFMLAPSLIPVDYVAIHPSISLSSGRLLFSLNPVSAPGDIDYHVFSSLAGYESQQYQFSQPRYMGVVRNSSSKSIRFGRLFNHYICNDPRGFAPPGWRIPTNADIVSILTSIYPAAEIIPDEFGPGVDGLWISESDVAASLRDVNSEYWFSNEQSSNAFLFSARAGGWRSYSVGFTSLKEVQSIMVSDLADNSPFWSMHFYIDAGYLGNPSPQGLQGEIYNTYERNTAARSVRLVYEGEDTPLNCIGNDGTIYPVAFVGGRYITAANSIETKFRDGSLIPNLTVSNDVWRSLNYAASCDFLNDTDYSFYESAPILDFTDNYIARFGVLPSADQFLRIRIVPAAISNGQFFPELKCVLPIYSS